MCLQSVVGLFLLFDLFAVRFSHVLFDFKVSLNSLKYFVLSFYMKKNKNNMIHNVVVCTFFKYCG